MKLLDTDELPAAERRPGAVAERLEATMASGIRFHGPDRAIRARLDVWDLGGVSVRRVDVTGDLSLVGPVGRADAAPVLSLAVQELGVGRQEQFDTQRRVPRGGLSLTAVGAPYDYRWSGRGICRALQIPVARLRLPVDVVRRAVPRAHLSPLYGLVRTHLEQVTRDAERLSRDPLAAEVAAATLDLARALVASAARAGRDTTDAIADTLLARVRSYVRQHLTEPDLDAQRIARAHAVSVRQLYRLCADADFSLEQWIIAERLDGARAELRDHASRDRSIAMVARRWGFSDPSYFSRRFRATYGLTPRDWRLSSSE